MNEQHEQLTLNYESAEAEEAKIEADSNSMATKSLSGFRLQRLEVYNWGTFDKQIWKLTSNGKNSLLTGDIGSGKSTLVDAITTLLVPSNRVAYNKAAGADNKERDLRSYVLGYYKSERSEASSVAKAVALRDHNDYSVILGVFANAAYNQTVTLAQVFWAKDSQSQPARFYVGAERDLSIHDDFSNFGSDISSLRKKLKAHSEVFESFSQYGAWFRRRFGIENEQALELFHQTVSMKSVGNLTDFVRTHMLQPFDVASRLEALIRHFDDLNSAHVAILKAESQIALLTPLVSDCHRHHAIVTQLEEWRLSREALKSYFAKLKIELLEKRIQQLTDDWLKHNAQVLKLEQQLLNQRGQEIDLRRNIAENGGDRLESLQRDIERKQSELKQRRGRNERYGQLVERLNLAPAEDADRFAEQRLFFTQQAEDKAAQEATLQNELTEAGVAISHGKEKHKLLDAEIISLKRRRSNIPLAQIEMRANLCKALKLDESDMPFAGELLMVREEERDWEGAAERVMRNFGLSLLVPDKHYAAVSDWVDQTHLQGRLVYYRVRTMGGADLKSPQRGSLASKISIKPDSQFYDWLEREVARRFDLMCCETQEQFRREVQAITRSGQIKGSHDRHEKDDRHRIDDRSRYILGWSNRAKIDALESQAQQLEHEIGRAAKQYSAIQDQLNETRERSQVLSKLVEYTEFSELDWRVIASEVDSLVEEKRQLQSSSDVLKQLNDRLNLLLDEMNKAKETSNEHREKRAKAEEKRSGFEQNKCDAMALLGDPDNAEHPKRFEQLDSMRVEALGDHTLSVESCDAKEREIRTWLQIRMDKESKQKERLQDRIVGAMTQYKGAYQVDTQEVDANVGAAADYEKMLKSLETDDLPRFKDQFKRLLNENTIREVANFHSQLAREREQIKERIEKINQSLVKIPYNPGRYIELEAQLTQDADVRDFQTELKACSEGMFTGSDDEQYSEQKFMQVQQIIVKFRGREGLSEQDRRWTNRVTDVRNWFTFGASERYCEDHKEHEHYTDSGGKSGGQKEKLAYTILAASLAYQFGLDEERSRSFRFVVIDEAFGRGSDDSAQFGLKLFEQMHLQLLVVTPMQKIHIIEPFVHNVGFVNNENGKSSKIRNLTIEEYNSEKAKLFPT